MCHQPDFRLKIVTLSAFLTLQCTGLTCRFGICQSCNCMSQLLKTSVSLLCTQVDIIHPTGSDFLEKLLTLTLSCSLCCLNLSFSLISTQKYDDEHQYSQNWEGFLPWPSLHNINVACSFNETTLYFHLIFSDHQISLAISFCHVIDSFIINFFACSFANFYASLSWFILELFLSVSILLEFSKPKSIVNKHFVTKFYYKLFFLLPGGNWNSNL